MRSLLRFNKIREDNARLAARLDHLLVGSAANDRHSSKVMGCEN